MIRTKRVKQERWVNVSDNEEEIADIPYFDKNKPKPKDKVKQEDRDNGKTDNEFFTGEKNKKLLVHIMQNGVEVTKPLRRKIYDQQVIWRKRVFPIDIKQALVDSKGLHHLYVSANDMATLSFRKDHEDNCRKCGGKMFIDAKNARDLVKRNTIQAIWGIDSTHMILLLVFAIAAMAMAGFAFYSYNQDTLHNTQLKAEQAKNAQLTIDYELLKNQTRQVIIPPTTNNPDAPDIPEPPNVRPSEGSSPLPDTTTPDRAGEESPTIIRP